MRGDEVIENGDVVIHDGRIISVGSSGAVAVPSDASIRDVTGKVIVVVERLPLAPFLKGRKPACHQTAIALAGQC
jgi:hypothetical protein